MVLVTLLLLHFQVLPLGYWLSSLLSCISTPPPTQRLPFQHLFSFFPLPLFSSPQLFSPHFPLPLLPSPKLNPTLPFPFLQPYSTLTLLLLLSSTLLYPYPRTLTKSFLLSILCPTKETIWRKEGREWTRGRGKERGEGEGKEGKTRIVKGRVGGGGRVGDFESGSKGWG